MRINQSIRAVAFTLFLCVAAVCAVAFSPSSAAFAQGEESAVPARPLLQHYFSLKPSPLERSMSHATRTGTVYVPKARYHRTVPSLRAAALTRPENSGAGSSSGGTVDAFEIGELANALQNDPDLIYQYVHDNIEFSPLWGALKGPLGTLLDGCGDSFDQAALMVSLLQQASVSNSSIANPTFEFGQIYLSSAQLSGWLGVDNNPASIAGVLAQGGIPAQINSDGSAIVSHVWVKVTLGGASYIFDPAFKQHQWTQGITANLPEILNYFRTQLIADANAQTTPDSISNINRTQMISDLKMYSTNLAKYIRQSMPMASVSDVLGGGMIIHTPFENMMTIRQSANPNQYGTATDWTDIPDEYHATLTVAIPGATAIEFYADQLYGHRLSIMFDTSYVPSLSVEGNFITSGKAASPGSLVGITFTVTVPAVDVNGKPFANQTHTQNIAAQSTANGAGYIVMNGWDQVGRGMIERHRRMLNLAMASEYAANSEEVLGESLSVDGCSWLAQVAAQQRITDRLLGTTSQYYYGVGIVGEAVSGSFASPYVDLPLNFIDTPSRTQGSTTNTLAAFIDGSGVASSFESAVLEQTQAPTANFKAASTVELIDQAVQAKDTIYDIYANNFSTIQPLLNPNYKTADLSAISCYVTGSPLPSQPACTNGIAGGYRVIAPLHGKIVVGNWTGVGYKAMQTFADGSSYMGEIISGGLSGGFGGTLDLPDSLNSNNVIALLPSPDSPTANAGGFTLGGGFQISGNGMALAGDPVSIQKGSYQLQAQDLKVGPKDFPYGLSLQRAYDSGAQFTAGAFGPGWTHNYAITATVGSDGFAGMGQSSLLASVSAIVALFVSSDLVDGQSLNGQTAGQSNLENFVLEAIVNQWFATQLTNNVVYVNKGWANEQFALMADGTYVPPTGSVSILDQPTSQSFRYRTRDGDTLTFNSANQVASWITAAGATVTFTYSGGSLSRVTSASGRYLSFSYNSKDISSVSDGNRTVSYGYAGGVLSTFNDALSQQTKYTYELNAGQWISGRLYQVFYPTHPSNAFVSNVYDDTFRVAVQQDADGNVTQSFFAGVRTEIDDPIGNRHVWVLDTSGNVLTDIQDYGASPHLNVATYYVYDNQNNEVGRVLPEGNTITRTYDPLFNPLIITMTPKPGSSLAQRKQIFTYTQPASATLPLFEEIASSTDPNGNVIQMSYNSGTGTLAEIDMPQVPKPGFAALQTPKQLFTYTAIGLPQTIQDAEGQIRRFDYDATHTDQVTQKTEDYGRLNLITRYGYDSYGDTNLVTDANGHTTTSKFDALRRVTEIDAPISGVVTKFAYYPNGQVKTQSRQLTTTTSETTQYTYTLSDKVSVVTDPLGSTTTTTYDADDRVQTVTQQVTATQNRQRTYSYDALGRKYQVKDTTAANAPVVLETHGYTPNGKDSSFTDANGNVIANVYDGFDELDHTTYPDHSTESYQYDMNGNTLQKTTRSGQTIGFTYDGMNRVRTKIPQGESAGQVTYGYDLTGRLMQASDGSSVLPYVIGYDTAGRANSFTDQQGRQMQSQHDGVGNRTQIQWPAGTYGSAAFFATFQFDAMNRMTGVLQNGVSPLAAYSWDVLSRLTLISYGDGTSDAYSQYDAADNLQTQTLAFGSGSSVTFDYGWQKNHQRSSTSVSDSAFQYSPMLGTFNYGPADVNNGYTTISNGSGNFTFPYDTNLNLKSDALSVGASVFDVENRLIQTQSLFAGTQTTFLYNPLGNRKQKQIGSITRQFLLADGQEVADYDGSGVGTPWVLTVPGVGGLPLASYTPSKGWITYYHHDVLGSTVAATAAGSTAQPYVYDEFGKTVAGSGLPYQFAGYRFDDETGLYYVGARYYSPSLGRFLQSDPIGSAGGANLYAYSGNDPINLTDPSGNCPWCIAIDATIGGLGGAVSGGVTGYRATGTWQGAAIGAGTGFVFGAATSAISPVAAIASWQDAALLLGYNVGTSIGSSGASARLTFLFAGGEQPNDSQIFSDGLVSGVAQTGFQGLFYSAGNVSVLGDNASNLANSLANANTAVFSAGWTLGTGSPTSLNSFVPSTPK